MYLVLVFPFDHCLRCLRMLLWGIMTIDQRLKSLAESMEVLQGMQMDNEKRFAANERRFQTVTHSFEVVLDSLKSLERTAAVHEGRTSHLEGD